MFSVCVFVCFGFCFGGRRLGFRVCGFVSACVCACVQLTAKEMELIHGMLADRNHKPMDTVRAVNTARRKAGVEEIDKTSIYRYINGETHRRGRSETRGARSLAARVMHASCSRPDIASSKRRRAALHMSRCTLKG